MLIINITKTQNSNWKQTIHKYKLLIWKIFITLKKCKLKQWNSIFKYQISRYKIGIIFNSILPSLSCKNPPFACICLGFETRWYENK